MILYQREQTLRADKDLRVEIFRGPEDIRLRYSASASNEVLLVETLVHPRVSGVAVLGSGYDFAEGFRSVGCGSGGVGGAGCCVYYAAA